MNRRLFTVNEVLAFFVELAALVAMGYWGLKVGDIWLAIAAPVLAATMWGLFAAPKAQLKVAPAAQLAVKVIYFGASVLALFATGHQILGAVFGVIILINTTAATIWRSRGFEFGQ